jgi:hypothetical protein
MLIGLIQSLIIAALAYFFGWVIGWVAKGFKKDSKDA